MAEPLKQMEEYLFRNCSEPRDHEAVKAYLTYAFECLKEGWIPLFYYKPDAMFKIPAELVEAYIISVIGREEHKALGKGGASWSRICTRFGSLGNPVEGDFSNG